MSGHEHSHVKLVKTDCLACISEKIMVVNVVCGCFF